MVDGGGACGADEAGLADGWGAVAGALLVVGAGAEVVDGAVEFVWASGSTYC